MRIIAGDKIDSKVFSFYKSHHFSEVAKLVIKGSKFVLFVDLYYLSSWVVKQSLIRNFDILMAVSAWPSQYPTVRIATYWNPEVFVLKKCFLQEVSFWMDNGHPSLQRNLTPRGNSSVSKWWTGLCLVWWLAAGFVRVGIQRHLFSYPGAGPGSWKRLDCACYNNTIVI